MKQKITSKILFSLVLILFSCKNEREPSSIAKAENIKVFRSVLDKIPRIATAVLHDNMWVAYNTQDATLYKAWKGGVNFDGAVYTTKHGPQPTSLGYAYYSSKEQWVLLKETSEIAPKIQYKGHRFENGQPIFKFILQTPNGEKIIVEESPIYKNKDGKNGLERHFKISNKTDYTVALKTVLSSLESEKDFATNGSFSQTNTETVEFESGKIINISGILKLNNGVTDLSLFFHPGFDKIEKNSNEYALKLTSKKESIGAELINGNDCVACHNETQKTVGPSYLEISKKYPNDEQSIKQLSAKIKLGGKGVWGEVPMTPHPNLSDSDLNKMVSYILSLNKKYREKRSSAKPKNTKKHTLGLKSKPLEFKSKISPNSGKGLVANLFVREPDVQEKVYVKKAIKNAITKSIHVLNTNDFGAHKTNIKIVFQGTINIPKEDSYNFRLVSDDGSYLYIDGKEVIDNGGNHGFVAVDGETYLKKGKHNIKIVFEQGGGGAAISFQWFSKANKKFELVTDAILSHTEKDFEKTEALHPKLKKVESKMAGDGNPLNEVHPSFDLFQARPDSFQPKVGGIDFIGKNTLVVSTWDPDGSVYLVKNYTAKNPEEITVKRIAKGLAEPLGVKVVDNDIYVLQKQELTRLIDHNGDEIIDEYETISNDWLVSGNFHEFAFGLVYKENHFYATLATAILPGGASGRQVADRGKVVKINKDTGATEFIASGLRTPNGIGLNVDNEIFVADNQGDWLPASKIVHIQEGKFYGSRSVDFEGTEGVEEKLPVVWLPQTEIGNSPSTPIYLNVGPFKNQLIHGEVTHGGIKRVAYEEVEGQLQGAVFRFTQGIESGVNRIIWAPDGSLVIGGIGVSGNWQHYGKLKYGLQRMKYNGKTTFEMLKINVKPNGFDIVFTEPIASDYNFTEKDIKLKQWYYKPTKAYGGPKLDLENLKIDKLIVSKDRKKVTVVVPNLKENHVVYFHLNNKLKSNNNNKLWTTEAWYTLNKIPVSQ